MCKLSLCNQKTMVKSVGALFGYLLRWSLLRSACFLSTTLEASKLSQTSIEQCVCKLSFAKNANICIFLWREPITITTTRSSSFFDLYIAGHYRLSGLPSPMVYSLIQILKDVQRTHTKSTVLDSWILSIVSACLFDVCKGVQYLYHTAYRWGLFHSFFLLSNPSIGLDRAAQPG